MKRLLLSLCLVASTGVASAQDAFLNEIHYDNAGTDVGEFVEVALATTESAADYEVVFYNGSNGTQYATYNLGDANACTASGTVDNGYALYVCGRNQGASAVYVSIQNGAPDGLAIVKVGATPTVLEFLSYEGTFNATNGPAAGLPSVDIGESETSGTPAGNSLQLVNGVWAENPESPGLLNSGASLPVELISFTGAVAGTSARLTWTTASETNNAGFDVQARAGGAWQTLGFVPGHGTTLEAQRYAFEARDLAPGTYTFRLRQVDFDGAFEYSDELELAVTVDGAFALVPAANPLRASGAFTLSVQRSQHVTAELYNLLGQRVALLLDAEVRAGTAQRVPLDVSRLPAGVYVYRVQGETFATSRQVTVLR